MHKKQSVKPFLVVTGVLLAAAINFPEYLMGSPATLKNLLITLGYLGMWIVIPTREFSPGGRFSFMLFWGGTLLIALVTAWVSVTGGSAVWAILPALPLLGPWYGLMFFASDYSVMAALVALFSLGMAVKGFSGFRKKDPGSNA